MFAPFAAGARALASLRTTTTPRLLARTTTTPLRSISSTAPRRATASGPGTPPMGVDEATVERLKSSVLWKKISAAPDALLAAKNFGEVLSKNGVDTLSGKQPSFLQMSKLLVKSDVRAAITTLVEEFGKAGIDLKDPETMKEVSSMTSLIKKEAEEKSTKDEEPKK